MVQPITLRRAKSVGFGISKIYLRKGLYPARISTVSNEDFNDPTRPRRAKETRHNGGICCPIGG